MFAGEEGGKIISFFCLNISGIELWLACLSLYKFVLLVSVVGCLFSKTCLSITQKKSVTAK